MRLSAEHWRQRARQTQTVADMVRDREVRQALLRIALDYRKHAFEAALDEMKAGVPPHRGRRQSTAPR
jgi:hypothetical protein